MIAPDLKCLQIWGVQLKSRLLLWAFVILGAACVCARGAYYPLRMSMHRIHSSPRTASRLVVRIRTDNSRAM